jgi:single-stranded-DNA-specific exonuclease
VELARRDNALLIDGAVSAAAANVELYNTIAQAGPFGAGNAEPVFALPNHSIAFADVVGEKHVRLRLRAPDGAMINAISFRAADKDLGRAMLASRGQSVHAAGHLTINRWQGTEQVQLRVLDIAPAGPMSSGMSVMRT